MVKNKMSKPGWRGCVTGLLLLLLAGSVYFMYTGKNDTEILLEKTEWEIPVSVIKGKEDGMTIYVVAGIHGNEKAGWYAAEKLKKDRISAGTIYIASPANRYGAINDQRKTEQERDLNRNFPGNKNGCDAEQIANAITEDILSKKPDLILDLHEAIQKENQDDFLGNSLICESEQLIDGVVFDLLQWSQQTDLLSHPLTLYGSPPQGSINKVMTEIYGIPVITTETYRGEPLETRVDNQLEIIHYVLDYYGMKLLNSD